mgnify:CR=1 FL=1
MEKTKEGEVADNHKGWGRKDKIRSTGKQKKPKKIKTAAPHFLSKAERYSCPMDEEAKMRSHRDPVETYLGDIFSEKSKICGSCGVCATIRAAYSKPGCSFLASMPLEKGIEAARRIAASSHVA